MEQELHKDVNSYLSFKLGDEVFALSVLKVNKILEMLPITEVPKSPDYMKGVINLRGKVLPVIDARVKFGLPPVAATKFTCMLVIEALIDDENIMVTLIVDAVQAVLKLKDEQILNPPSIGNKFKADFITGMSKVKDKFVMILDIDKVLSSDDLINIKAITEIKKAIKKETTQELTN